jgi:hypothetical protein
MLETWPAFQQAATNFGWSGLVQFRKFVMCLEDNIREKFDECEHDHYNAVTNKTAANLGLCLGHTIALHHGIPNLKNR